MRGLKKSSIADKTKILMLIGGLTVKHIEEALRELAKVISSADHIIIDCHKLEKIDDKGLKFLCSAHRHIMSRNRTVEIKGLIPEVVQDARNEMGYFVPGLSCDRGSKLQCIWKI